MYRPLSLGMLRCCLFTSIVMGSNLVRGIMNLITNYYYRTEIKHYYNSQKLLNTV